MGYQVKFILRQNPVTLESNYDRNFEIAGKEFVLPVATNERDVENYLSLICAQFGFAIRPYEVF